MAPDGRTVLEGERWELGDTAQARELLKSLPSLVDVDVAPEAHITVCGDVHGQFYDLLHIFELNGLPSEDNPYVFNGAQNPKTPKTLSCGHSTLSFSSANCASFDEGAAGLWQPCAWAAS